MKKNKVYVTCYCCNEEVDRDYTLKDDYRFICLDCLYDEKENSR